MLKKMILYTMTFFFSINLYGCYTNRQITYIQIESDPEYQIQMVVTKTGEVYYFPDGATLIDDMIAGYTDSGEYIEISWDQIENVYPQQFSATKLTVCTWGCIIVSVCVIYVGIMMGMALSSLPF